MAEVRRYFLVNFRRVAIGKVFLYAYQLIRVGDLLPASYLADLDQSHPTKEGALGNRMI